MLYYNIISQSQYGGHVDTRKVEGFWHKSIALHREYLNTSTVSGVSGVSEKLWYHHHGQVHSLLFGFCTVLDFSYKSLNLIISAFLPFWERRADSIGHFFFKFYKEARVCFHLLFRRFFVFLALNAYAQCVKKVRSFLRTKKENLWNASFAVRLCLHHQPIDAPTPNLISSPELPSDTQLPIQWSYQRPPSWCDLFFGRKRIWLWARLTERQYLRHLSVCANLLISNSSAFIENCRYYSTLLP